MAPKEISGEVQQIFFISCRFTARCVGEIAMIMELEDSTGEPVIQAILLDICTNLNGPAIEHSLTKVRVTLRRKEKPLDSELVSREVGQTSQIDDRSVGQRITSWQKGDRLGMGAYGAVYKAITDDGFFFAVKEVLDHGDMGKMRMQLEQEISLLSRLQHENIVQYYGTKQDGGKLYLYLELMTRGSLVTLYKKNNLSHSEVSACTWQILNGLKYLHDQDVVHRDIKCANVLVHASGSVKLADFGVAKVIKKNDAKSFVGSPYWMAPEVVTGNQCYGRPADIWSVGCTVLEMFICQNPYHPLEPQQAIFRIIKGQLPSVPDSISTNAQDFILQCLRADPDKRPSAVELLDHPFVRNASSGFALPHFNNMGMSYAVKVIY